VNGGTNVVGLKSGDSAGQVIGSGVFTFLFFPYITSTTSNARTISTPFYIYLINTLIRMIIIG
jgi:hypothetical protein